MGSVGRAGAAAPPTALLATVLAMAMLMAAPAWSDPDLSAPHAADDGRTETGRFALSGVLASARLGATGHDLDFFNRNDGGEETGFNVEAELVAAPVLLRVLGGRIRPYGHFSVNSDGGTNVGGVGLIWTSRDYGRWYGEGFAGPSLHDGVGDLDRPPGDPVRERLDDERIVFGSQVVARLGLAAGYRLNRHWDLAAYYAHYSHGFLLDDDFNDGLDTLGLRLGYTPGK